MQLGTSPESPLTTTPLQFAVVREDPSVEAHLVASHLAEGTHVARVLLVASGGCTAFALACQFPRLEIALVDRNPAQLAHVIARAGALSVQDRGACLARFNVGTAARRGLSQCGNFERLFDALRGFLHALVVSPEEIAAWFDGEGPGPEAAFASPYWSLAFETHFSDSVLNAMFGREATQHAAPGSYATYFRTRLEAALLAEDARSNYFLHHIFEGAYRSAHLPPYLREGGLQGQPHATFEAVEGSIQDVPALDRFDLIHLSNIFDWMHDAEAEALRQHLIRRVRPGARIVWRQLNNQRDRVRWLAPAFFSDPALDALLTARERSAFYSAVHAARRQEA